MTDTPQVFADLLDRGAERPVPVIVIVVEIEVGKIAAGADGWR
jgi:hypothetical protein